MSVDPLTIAFAVASTGTQILGVLATAKREKAVLARQREIALRNQALANQAAERQKQIGDIEKRQVEARSQLVTKQQIAGLAGAGVDVTGESAVSLVRSTEDLFGLDARTAKFNREERARELEEKGISFGIEAQNLEAARSNINPFFDVVGSLLSLGSKAVEDKWFDLADQNSGLTSISLRANPVFTSGNPHRGGF